MNTKKHTKKIRRVSLKQRMVAVALTLFIATGTYLLIQGQAAAGYIYISPAKANKYVGDSFSVQVRIKTTSVINAAFVNLNYNANGLQVLSIQRGADFPNQNAQTQHTISGGTGTIKMQSTRNNSAAGDFHYATISFKAKATGTYGVSPLSSSSLINYPSNTVSFTYGRGDYTFTTKPAPAPKPAPKPAPVPTAPAPKPAPKPAPVTYIPETSSAPSASNLKISNFKISDIGYRSAVLTWNTNKPATSKVNYGDDDSNMPHEISSQAKTTNHKLLLQGDTVRAGKNYAVRITSDDGNGPVTLDGQFSTNGIFITIVVSDSQGQPVAGATVSTASTDGITDDSGKTGLIVSEGSLIINVKKDDMSTDVTAEIAVPGSAEAAPQQIAVTLSPATATDDTTTDANQSGRKWLIPLLVLVFAGIAFGVFLWRKRRQASLAQSYSSDTDIAVTPTTPPENMHPPAPTSPPPINISSGAASHYPTLPELVEKDLQAQRRKTAPSEQDLEPVDMFSQLDNPSQYNQPAPHPTEHHPAKPEPKKPEPHPHSEPKEKPAPKHPTPEPEQKPEQPKPHNQDTEIDPKDHSLHINHND